MIIKNVSKKYADRVVLDDISVRFGTGLNFIIGDSGEGKSTILNIIGALDVPDAGAVFYDGREVSAVDGSGEAYRSGAAGFVFQDANLIYGLTVLENIEVAAAMSARPKSTQEIDRLLEEFNISQFRDETVDTLSGGEKQRAALVRALAKNAEVILADEPTGSLDSENTEIVFRYLKKISKDHIVIVITHNMELADLYGDTVSELKNGKLIPVKEAASPDSGEAYSDRKDPGNQEEPEDREKPEARENPDDRECRKKRNDRKDQEYAGFAASVPGSIIRKLVLNHIKRHRWKFVFMVAALAVVSMLPASVYLLKAGVKSNLDTLNAVYYDLDEVDIYASYLGDTADLSNLLGDGGYFTSDVISEVTEDWNFAEVVPYVGDTYHLDTYEEISIKPILPDDFFRDRLMTDEVEGDFPQNINEMIIGEDLAQTLFSGDAIGGTFTIYDSYGNAFELNVVGVNHQSNVDGIYYNYICTELLCGNMKQEYSCPTYIYEADKADESDKYEMTSFTEDASGYTVTTLTDADVIYGDDTPADGEIVVSLDVFKDLYAAMTGKEAGSVTAENFERFVTEDEEAGRILNARYYIGGNDYYEVFISGVHDGSEYELLVSEDFYKEINEVLPDILQCYVSNYDQLEELTQIDQIGGYSIYSYYSDRFSTVADNSRKLNALFLLLLAITAVVFVLVVNSFVRISLSDKMAQIGILKSLGAGKKDLAKLLICDNGLLGALAGITAGILYLIFALLLPVFTNLSIGSRITFLVILVIVCVLPCVVSVLLTLPGTKRIVERKPVDLLGKH